MWTLGADVKLAKKPSVSKAGLSETTRPPVTVSSWPSALASRLSVTAGSRLVIVSEPCSTVHLRSRNCCKSAATEMDWVVQ